MSDISKIKIANVEYNVKDSTARTGLASKQDTLDSTSANANVIAPLYVDTGELRLALGNGLHKVVDDLEVEVKSNGGITLDANGISVDTSIVEVGANKVTSLSSSSTDTQYPSAKCVYDLVGNIETLLGAI